MLVCFVATYAQERAELLYDKGNEIHSQSDFAKALEYFDSSRTVALLDGDYVMYFSAYGMFLDCLEKNAEIRRWGLENDLMRADLLLYKDKISAYNYRRFGYMNRIFHALNLTDLGNSDEAIKVLTQMLDSLNAVDNSNDQSLDVNKFKLLHYISVNYLEQGNFDQSVYYANEAIMLTPSLPNMDGWLLNPRFTKATSFIMTGQSELAIAELRDIPKLSPEIVQRRSERIAEAYSKIAQLHLKINNPDSALYYLDLLKQLDRTGLEAKLEAGLLESEIYYTEGEFEVSKEACLKVSEILIRANSEQSELNGKCRLQFGKIAMKQGELVEALSLVHLALRNFSEDFEGTDPMTNPALGQLYHRLIPVEVLYFKSKILSDLYESTGDIKYLEASWNTSSLGVDFVDKLRQSYYDTEDKAFLIEQSYRVFSQALMLCHLQLTKPNNETWADTAYALMERSKALNLMDAVKHENARQFAGIPDSILEIESQLRLGISLREESIRELKSADKDNNEVVLRTRSALEEEKKTYRALLTSIEVDYPDYYQLRYGASEITLKNIQVILGEDESVLEYFVAEKEIFTLLIEKNRKKLFMNHDAGLVENLIGTYRASIQACVDGTNNKMLDSMYINTAVDLYKILIRPVLPLKNSIIVIQDGPLYYLSFAGLITETPEQYYDWRKHAYMVDDSDISYCYSMSLCNELRKKAKSNSDRSMVFAPDFEQDEEVSQLTFNGEEATQVALMTSGESLMNEECTSTAVREILSAKSGYRLVHFATHGIANTTNGTDSYLQFAGPPESNKLYARELYNYSLNADLVYLSACETGSGQLRRGEGVVSIARAFFFAGTRSLVTALWSISDERAKDLTLGFYKELMAAKSVDCSVANSQRRYIANLGSEDRNFAHPAYWSALVPIGNSTAIVQSSNLSWLLYLSGVLIILFVMVRIFKRN